jgi:hypothetical protein
VSAEFFAPEMGNLPVRRLPPRMRIRSMEQLLSPPRARASSGVLQRVRNDH